LTLLYRTLDRHGSPLEPQLRALVQVRVSQINWCTFCVDLNGAAALERHATREKLAALIAFQSLSSKFNAALAVPAQGFCVRQTSAPPGVGK
ncbi:MAG: carboxymuconolactone decarboxylase family protein, partial [Burkholderiales bacterium]